MITGWSPTRTTVVEARVCRDEGGYYMGIMGQRINHGKPGFVGLSDRRCHVCLPPLRSPTVRVVRPDGANVIGYLAIRWDDRERRQPPPAERATATSGTGSRKQPRGFGQLELPAPWPCAGPLRLPSCNELLYSEPQGRRLERTLFNPQRWTRGGFGAETGSLQGNRGPLWQTARGCRHPCHIDGRCAARERRHGPAFSAPVSNMNARLIQVTIDEACGAALAEKELTAMSRGA